MTMWGSVRSAFQKRHDSRLLRSSNVHCNRLRTRRVDLDEINTCATRYTNISFDEAIAKNLQVLDATAFALCRDQKLPIKVFSIFKPGALKRVVMGEDEGTLVHV